MITEIPVKPWMFKFLAREYGNPYIMDKRDAMSNLLFTHLGNKKEVDPAIDCSNGNTLPFKIRIATRYYMRRNLVDIPNVNKQALRTEFEEKFYDRLVEFVYSRQQIKNEYEHLPEIKNNITIRSSIQLFLSRYHITDNDYEITSVERRYRMHLDKKLLTKAVHK